MNFSDFNLMLHETFPDLTKEQEQRFQAMEAFYTEWNAKINVISRKDIDNLYEHHILHSLSIAKYLRSIGRPEGFGTGATVLDLGTGGGFPGIPLATLFPKSSFTLCDSVGKKVLVTSEAAKALSLDNVQTINARVESLKENFDWIVTRAVAPLPDLYGWVRGRYTKSLLCLKGGDVNPEINALIAKHHVKKSAIRVWNIGSWLPGEWFSEKFLIEIR